MRIVGYGTVVRSPHASTTQQDRKLVYDNFLDVVRGSVGISPEIFFAFYIGSREEHMQWD